MSPDPDDIHEPKVQAVIISLVDMANHAAQEALAPGSVTPATRRHLRNALGHSVDQLMHAMALESVSRTPARNHRTDILMVATIWAVHQVARLMPFAVQVARKTSIASAIDERLSDRLN